MCLTFYKKCVILLESGVVLFLAKIRMNIHAIWVASGPPIVPFYRSHLREESCATVPWVSQQWQVFIKSRAQSTIDVDWQHHFFPTIFLAFSIKSNQYDFNEKRPTSYLLFIQFQLEKQSRHMQQKWFDHGWHQAYGWWIWWRAYWKQQNWKHQIF